ncbi:MAG: hypothetical protein Q9M92_14555 [Enterobacterales bacterium]|nr:hypothetical protein [Enterobacterales bacterium]
MSIPSKPNLTNLVEQKFLAQLEQEETIARDSNKTLSSNIYMRLANLYHFHRDLIKEEAILVRYSELPFADKEQLLEIYERIEELSNQRHILNENKMTSINSTVPNDDKAGLSLLSIESEDEFLAMSSDAKVFHKHKDSQPSLEEKDIRILTIGAIFTGQRDDDELIEISVVLFDYCANQDKPFQLIETYTGNRETIKAPPEAILSKYFISPDAHQITPLDREKILYLFDLADYVVSHGQSDVERKLIVTLFPELIDAEWYSSKKDIPWRALGFESIELADIIQSYGRRRPRTSMEQAKSIFQLLKNTEPESDTLYIERIHYMKPMKPLTWTDEMQAQHLRLNEIKPQRQFKGAGLFVVFIIAAIWVFDLIFDFIAL